MISDSQKQKYAAKISHFWAIWPTNLKILLLTVAALIPLVLVALAALIPVEDKLTQLQSKELYNQYLAGYEHVRWSINQDQMISEIILSQNISKALPISDKFNIACDQFRSRFNRNSSDTPVGYAVLSTGGSSPKKICGSNAASSDHESDKIGKLLISGKKKSFISKGSVLYVVVQGDHSHAFAILSYSRKVLAKLLGYENFPARTFIYISNAHDLIPLHGSPDGKADKNGAHPFLRKSLGLDDVSLTFAAPPPPKSNWPILLLSLPFIMACAATLVALFVVRLLLIRPLARLHAAVAAYRDDGFNRFPKLRAPTREITDLAAAFAEVIDRAAAHEAELAQALEEQRKLAREVYHRVRNNLQLISSLIHLHARDAAPGAVRQAYGGIQRRVDALALVHRNHYAASEANDGIDGRHLLGEMITGLSASLALPKTPTLSFVQPQFTLHQDVAIPVLFLLTELVEISANIDISVQPGITIQPGDTDDRLDVLIVSRAYRDRDALETMMATRYGRVIEGLGRQLRTPVERTQCGAGFRFSCATMTRPSREAPASPRPVTPFTGRA